MRNGEQEKGSKEKGNKIKQNKTVFTVVAWTFRTKKKKKKSTKSWDLEVSVTTHSAANTTNTEKVIPPSHIRNTGKRFQWTNLTLANPKQKKKKRGHSKGTFQNTIMADAITSQINKCKR